MLVAVNKNVFRCRNTSNMYSRHAFSVMEEMKQVNLRKRAAPGLSNLTRIAVHDPGNRPTVFRLTAFLNL